VVNDVFVQVTNDPNVTHGLYGDLYLSSSPINLNQGAPAGGVYFGQGISFGQFDPNIGVGTYQVGYTFSNSCGSDTAFSTIEVLPDTVVCTPPIADFYSSTQSGIAPLLVDYFNLSTNATSYDWTFYGADIENYNNSNPAFVTYTSNGLFTTKLKVSNACGTDSIIKPAYVNVDLPSSLKDIEQVDLSIYPNPTESILNLVSSYEGMVNLKIVNQLGQEVSHNNNNIDLSKGVYSINTQNYSMGVYNLFLLNSKGEFLKVIKFIKQ